MNNKLTVFNNADFGEIRTLEENGTVLFCGNDVAKALGYARPSKAVLDHCKGVLKRDGVSLTTNQHGVTTEQTVEMNFIPEGDVYRLIARSKLPTAERFESWVFDEVLPSIRKNGEYVTPKAQQKRLGEVNSAARIIRQTLKEAGMAPQFVAVAMKSLYEPVGVEIPLEGITLNKRLFDATAIAKQLGVLSLNGNPHAQAISAIIAQVDVQPGEKELAPFQNTASGHSGTCIQYTDSVVSKVRNWLEMHNYPSCLEYHGKTYTVRYDFN